MTDGGEHGGSSPEETDAGLFVYRRPMQGESPPLTCRSELTMINQVKNHLYW